MSNIQKQHKISPAIAWLTIQKFIIFYCPLDGEHTKVYLRGIFDTKVYKREHYLFSELHSGKPVMLVSSDNIPASMDVEITNFVSICPSTVTVPIVAMAVCATVFIALIPAHLAHFFQSFAFMLPSFLFRVD